MIVTFPHMGTMSIVLQALFENLECQVLVPPPITKRTMELGTRFSPETVCLPFKLTLGNFIEALEQGADTLVTCGGVGPCRLGYYGTIQQELLEQLGYQFRMIMVEPDLVKIYRQLNYFAPHKNWYEVYKAFRLAGCKMNLLDELGREMNRLRAYEAKAGSLDSLWDEARREIILANNCQTVNNLRERLLQRVKAVRLVQRSTVLRIAIVGEIYVMLEPFVNQNLERRLGSMGAEVFRTMSLTDYVKGQLLRRQSYLDLYKKLSVMANPYLGHPVGGHALKSIAYTVFQKQQGYDGIIQVYPFTCMPEVIAKNILPKVSQDVDMPVLTLAYDEQTGEAGMMTRLEAFIDLLKYRKAKLDKVSHVGNAIGQQQ
ncbi:hypothetical protein [Sporomusa acidovorans]|uniref:2-hydroxyglutaryl-CoA dehydratase, D-component n=1 Tax=Sporomusa acidovorans (strain ATCC 49682 / DSM 3132 / Mol) TaxID=1123286 RepID=A0ABZ3IWD8_SPOA4|nr:hypothetical protein [Sporomusa acidovorans]OZC23689.1 2-hydroxyglutaryl-CoA dehydratase, D-component [Sporomusa acidovorans DSM 3132]SDE25285.1 Predicted nucleotide-binding protein, sugar kinase/HSP70/actin superfamily [Sporomusa acidovorans]